MHFERNPHWFRPDWWDSSTFPTFCCSSLPPELKLRGLGRGDHKLQLIQNPQRQNRQRGHLLSSRPRPASPLSPLASPRPIFGGHPLKETLGTSWSSLHRRPRSTSSPRPGAGANWRIHQGALQPPSRPARGPICKHVIFLREPETKEMEEKEEEEEEVGVCWWV